MGRPNILIVMTDHQRADTIHPNHPCQTPHLERLAGQGITFTNAFCPAPHCCPSRATFFSGLYPSGHGVWNNVLNDQALRTGLRDGVRLWSEDLAAAGYRNHFVGKWHLSAHEGPSDRGWEEHAICAGPYGERHGDTWGKAASWDRGGQPGLRHRGEIQRPGWWTYATYGSGDGNGADLRSTETAVGLIGELATGDDPWCCYVGLTGPHDPYVVPARYLDRYPLDDIPLPTSFNDPLTDKPNLYRRMREQLFDQLTPDEHADALRHYWAYCTWLDERVGDLLAALEQSGQADDTIVVFTADHGDYAAEHGLWSKGIPCFSGAYHVPAVIRWPGHVSEPGSRVRRFVSLADFGPTLLEAAGIDAPAQAHQVGRSLLPFLASQVPEDWRDDIATQLNGTELLATQRSIRTRDWHYTFNGFDFDELYDLRNDHRQLRNLARDPQYEGIIRNCCRRLWRFARASGDACPSAYITVGLAPFGPGILAAEDEDGAPEASGQ